MVRTYKRDLRFSRSLRMRLLFLTALLMEAPIHIFGGIPCGDGPYWTMAQEFSAAGMTAVRALAWSPDGSLLASGSSDGLIRIWDIKTGTVTRSLIHGSSAVTSVTWSPDGAYLASGSGDTTIKIWDVSTGKLFCPPLRDPDARPVNAVAWSPDGGEIISAAATPDGAFAAIRIWDARFCQGFSSGGPYSTNQIYALAWSPLPPQGQPRFASVTYCPDCSVRVWSYSGTLIRTIGQADASLYAVAWSADGHWIAAGNGGTSTGCSACLYLYQEVGTQWFARGTLRRHTARINSLSWCPNPAQRLLASAASDGKIWIWNIDTGSPTYVLEAHATSGCSAGEYPGVRAMVWSPDGSLIASGGGCDGKIRIWEYLPPLK